MAPALRVGGRSRLLIFIMVAFALGNVLRSALVAKQSVPPPQSAPALIVTHSPSAGAPLRRAAAVLSPLPPESSSAPRTTSDTNTKEAWDRRRPLLWKRRDLYLPIPEAARAGFLANNEKQKVRMKSDQVVERLWTSFNISSCLQEVPECEFWKAIEAPVVYRKCCVEHIKMKQSLFYALDVAEKFGLQIFLDSGTLLSAIRDGGDTLVPWETDIDLGIVGVDPKLVAEPFTEHATRDTGAGHRHHFSACLTKVSKNVSRNGMCRDAHYVYYASTEDEAKLDTSRVEIWPFWPEGDFLVHPTRKKLTVNRTLVEPLVFGGRCRIWGRPCWCPRDPEAYLDHEYTPDWRVPKTIHWGKQNIQSWKPLPPGIAPKPPKRAEMK